MDASTQANVAEQVRQAQEQLEAVFECPDDADHVWACVKGVQSRLRQIGVLLEASGYKTG